MVPSGDFKFHQASRGGRNFGEKSIDVEGQPPGAWVKSPRRQTRDTAQDTEHFTYKLRACSSKTMVCPSGKPPVNS